MNYVLLAAILVCSNLLLAPGASASVPGQAFSAVRPPAGAAHASGAAREIVLYNFLGAPGAASPVGPLLERGGDFIGASDYGGAANQGTVFSLRRKNGVFQNTILFSFDGTADGIAPTGGVVTDAGGALYGTTSRGGVFTDYGTVYKLTPTGSGYQETLINQFLNDGDGASPVDVILDSTGTLYGATETGGSANDGVVFKLAPSGSSYVETVLHAFQGGQDGAQPAAGVLLDGTGAIYGTTNLGGKYGAGTVYKLTPAGSGYQEQVIYTFQGIYDGANPASRLIAGKNGTLYGTTERGGGPGYFGTVFALKPTGKGYRESIIYAFQGGSDGAFPASGLALASDGALYGTTIEGGLYNDGTIYALYPAGGGTFAESVLWMFEGGPNDGLLAYGPPLLYHKTLYGTTGSGGLGGGIFFEVTSP
jgi:uncharacterized repeat protein (TIGR03803 family)